MYWQNIQLIRTLIEKSGPVAALAFSPDGFLLAIGSCESAVKLFQVATGDRERTLFGYPLGVDCLSISPDGNVLAIGAPDGNIDLWQLENGKFLGKMALKGRVTSIAFSPDGEILASGSDRSLVDTVFAISPTQTGSEQSAGGAIKLWDAKTGHLKQLLCESDTPVNTLAISPDGTKLASGHRDGTIKIWQLGDGRLLHILRGHTDAVYAIAISLVSPPVTATKKPANSPINSSIKGDREEESSRLADNARESKPEQNLGSKSNLKSQLLVSGSGDGTIRLWDLETGTSTKTLADHTDVVYSLSISPNGQTLASGSGDGTIKLWQLDGTLLQTISSSSGPPRAIMSVAFSPNSSLLASGSGDGRIHIWQGME